MTSESISHADDETPGFVIAPITTEAQRSVVSPTASFYAVVNCDRLLEGDKLRDDAPLLTKLEQQLKSLDLGKEDQLKVELRYGIDSDLSEATEQAIAARIVGLGRSSGFRKVTTTQTQTSLPWEEALAPLQAFAESQSAAEPVVDTHLITVYPVRTKLSKFVLGDVDCVVEIKRPFDGRQTDLAPELRESIVRAVQSSDAAASKGTLLFRVSSTTAGGAVVEQVFNSRQRPVVSPEITSPPLRALLEKQAADYKPSPAMKLATDLGFSGIRYAHSPGGGAPEKLIGAAAPDFELKSLDGELLELRKHRSGRPALITFWGVACGPCCAEAPYLTEMQAKYGDKLAIVAVNAYEESRETVAAFVERQQLKHSIVLGGESVAEKKYLVGSYPTTFWVSADGIVQDYDVGFDSVAALEERVKQFIEP